jgi:hypothetical protein
MDRSPEEPLKVNDIIGNTPPFLGLIPTTQAIFWGVSVVLAWLVCGLTGVGFGWEFIILSIGLITISTFVLGTDPSEYLDKLRPPPAVDFINGHIPYLSPVEDWRPSRLRNQFKGKLLIRTRTHKVILPESFQHYMPLQNFTDAICLVEVVSIDGPVAGVLLQRGKSLEIHWYWEITGIHDHLTASEASSVTETLENGIHKLLETERLMISMSNFSDDESQLEVLDETVSKCPSPVLAVIAENKKQKVQSLSKAGYRRNYRHIARGTWSTDGNHSGSKRDWTDSLLNILSGISGNVARSKRAADQVFYTQLLQQAYTKGYVPWELALKSMGLKPRPMSSKSLYAHLCSRFSDKAPGPVPQVLRLELTGTTLNLSEEINSDKHLFTSIIEGTGNQDSVIQHQGVTNRITLPGRRSDRREVGAMVLSERPKRFKNTWDLLKWSTNILASDQGFNCEVYVELVPQKPFIIRQALSMTQKSAVAAQERAMESGIGRDVGAERNAKSVTDAQEKLYDNVVPIAAAPLILVYRSSPAALTRSCNLLGNEFITCNVQRDKHRTWEFFLQSTSLINQPLLEVTMGNRRQILESDTVQGLMPLTTTKDLDNKGVEFISVYGNKPIHLDLFADGTAETMLVLGQRGSGKTALGWELILHYASQGIPVVGIDVNTDGIGSYKDGIELLGKEVGGYLDLLKVGCNFIEPPNIYAFDKEVRLERYEIWKELTIAALYSLSVGKTEASNPSLADRINQIVQISFRIFLEDSSISYRYREALRYGYQSSEWSRIPIITDWLNFVRREKLGFEVFTDLDEMAVSHIQAQFAATLGSLAGKAINQPTTFNPRALIRFFSIPNSANSLESLLLALSADMLSSRLSLEYPYSLFIGDEVSVMLQFPGFDTLYARKAALGRKGGQAMVLITQEFETLRNCRLSSMILGNLRIRAIGALEETGATALSQNLRYPEELLRKNSGGYYCCSANEPHRYWLIEKGGRFWQTLWFPGDMVLSTIANNPDELQARQQFLKVYPNDMRGQLTGLQKFSSEYVKSLRNHTPIREISPPFELRTN